MGIVIPKNKFICSNTNGLMRPIIYCTAYQNKKSYPINVELAQELVAIRPYQRTMNLERCLIQIVDMLPADSVIREFDVMFNPAYQVDVLKILISACKKKSFSVIWPGRYEDGKLFYSENGFEDYKVYDVKNYDVTCIV